MGCTVSSEKSVNSVDVKALSPRAVNTGTSPQQTKANNTQQSKSTAHPVANVQVEPRAVISSFAQEDKIELIFKAKRANVFSAGLSANERSDFRAKIINKSAAETAVIRKALDNNFVFASLDDNEKTKLSDAMEKVSVKPGESLIKQGEEGDYFYVIEKGTFSVIVGGRKVSELDDGRSFGELALLYNTPRAATIRAETPCVVYALDRETFRMTVANCSMTKSAAVIDSLMRVPCLSGLTETQISKIADTVEMLPYPSGDQIIMKGTEGNVFYMIKEGTVRVKDIGDDNTYADHTLGPGEYFGERALITGAPRAANVYAVTNCILMAIDRVSFTAILGPLKEILDQNMILRVLGSIKMFDTLDQNGKLRLARAFALEVFPKGTTIIKEGTRGTKMYILNDGKARVNFSNVTSVKGVENNEISPGKYFGESSLVEDKPRTSTIVTSLDSEFFTLSREKFNEVMAALKHPLGAHTESAVFKLPVNEVIEPPLTYKFNDLVPISILGSGTFGRVSLVREKNTQNIYALKAMLKTEIVAHKQQNNVLNEKNIMMSCNHPFILRMYQTFKDVRKLYMLLEFVQGGELFAVLHTSRSDGVSDAQAKFYAVGIILALGYLHKKDIAYRDLKPENCLIDKDGYPKLIDFGFAKILTNGAKTYTLCGTPEYLAPELVLGRGHNRAVDYWAFGILIYEMQAGFSPFSDAQGMDQVVICRNIVNGKLQFPRNFNTDCKDLVKRLLVREIQNRLGNQRGGVEDVVKHPWFNKIDFGAYFERKLKAPWIPKVKSITDCSHFDPYGIEDHPSDGPIDNGTWDRSF